MMKKNEPLRVGLAAHYGTELYKDAERVARTARLMLDDRWPQRFTKWQVHPVTGTVEGRRGKLPPEPLDQVAGALADSTTNWVELKTPGPEWHDVSIKAGTERDLYPTHVCPFRAMASINVDKLPAPRTDVYRWVTLAHDLVSTVGARNATITVAPSGDVILDQSIPYLPDPNDDLLIMGGGPALGDAQRNVGGKYARYPRWGTYLHAEHVAAIGGRDRIAREVEPALFEQLDDLLYIQLTAGIDDAWTPAMWAKRLKLRKLMESILVPPT